TPNESGMVMGTPAYMSPEQSRGEDTDRLTDVWAFGCVLYEMLTGVRLFAGNSTSEILANVLTFDPMWKRLPADTPGGVLRLLRRCLQRDRSDRLRDIGDARLEIVEALNAPAAEVRPPARAVRSRATWALAVIGTLAVGLGGLVAGWFLRTPPH